MLVTSCVPLVENDSTVSKDHSSQKTWYNFNQYWKKIGRQINTLFKKTKRKDDSPTTSTSNLQAEQTFKITTPNHGSLKLSSSMKSDHFDDVQLSPIVDATANHKAEAKAPGVKPADMWIRDQSRMLEGNYPHPARFRATYRLKQMLGEGSFGFVWVAERLSDSKEFSVKFILRDKIPPANWMMDTDLGLVPQEVQILKSCSHPNIIAFVDYFSDLKFCYLVTELHGTSWSWPNGTINVSKNPGLKTPQQLLLLSQSQARECFGIAGLTRRLPCDLFECIEAHSVIPIKTIQFIFNQLLDAVLYLHCHGIVHRDLKDENIVVDEDYRIKLIDFGSSSRFHRTPDGREPYFDKFNGTIAYAAPEIIKGQKYHPSEAEVWTMGVLLYTMIFRKSPFSSTEEILSMNPKLPNEESTGPFDLLSKMLHKDSNRRIKLTSIKLHPFMQ